MAHPLWIPSGLVAGSDEGNWDLKWKFWVMSEGLFVNVEGGRWCEDKEWRSLANDSSEVFTGDQCHDMIWSCIICTKFKSNVVLVFLWPPIIVLTIFF